MLGILKQAVSKKLSSIVESLSPANHASGSTPNSLKRTRVEEGTYMDGQEVKADQLMTPPQKKAKRNSIKVIAKQNRRESGHFAAAAYRNIRSFIDVRKPWSNRNVWNYVVNGGSQNDSSLQNSEESCIEKPDMENASSFASKERAKLSSSSSWLFRKTEEPAVRVSTSELNHISKRKSINSAKMNSDQSSPKQKDNTKPRPDIPPLIAYIPQIEIPSSDEDTDAAMTKKNLRSNSVKATLPVNLTTRRKSSTAQEVIRLEERDRYRKLLAKFTCHNPSAQRSGDLTSHGKDVSASIRKSDPDDHSFARLKHADSMVAKLKSSLPDHDRPSLVLSSSRILADADVLRAVPELVSKEKLTSQRVSTELRDSTRSFSGRNTANISRFEDQSDKTDGFLGNSWTSKWRKILAEDEEDRQKDIAKEENKIRDLKKKRKERDIELLKKVEARKKLDKSKVVDDLPVLTEEMRSMVSSVLRHGNPSETLCEAFNVSITRHDIATLAKSNWLNDEVVNFYFNLLQARSSEPGKLKMHFFNSFFYPKLLKTGYAGVRRWTKKVDIFAMDIVVLPVHLGMHWCLAAIDMRKKQIAYYDSLKGNNAQCLAALRNYILEEHKDKKKSSIDISGWTQAVHKDIPEQLNGCDCGVFTCRYADCLTRDAGFNFSQNDMPYFRQRMIYEIVTKKLL